MSLLRPDNVIWSWPWVSFCFGWTFQRYAVSAWGLTVCVGVLTLRWHKRKGESNEHLLASRP